MVSIVLELTDENYEKEVLQCKTPVIVDFWASWCGPCRMMGPVFEDLSSEYEGKLKFAKVSTEEFGELADANQIREIPCLIIFNKGAELERIKGFAPKPVIKQKIDEILARIR